jgi:hypothetical protein
LAECFEPAKVTLTVCEVEMASIPGSVLAAVLDADLALFTMVQPEPTSHIARHGELGSSEHRSRLWVRFDVVEGAPSK